MKCISDELLQKYIDRETSKGEEEYVKEHLQNCVQCAEKVDDMQYASNRIKQLLRFVEKEEIEIPTFKSPVHDKRSANFKIIIYSVSAACLIFFFTYIFHNPNKEIESSFSYDLEGKYNANLPLIEQEMKISIYDSNGNLIVL